MAVKRREGDMVCRGCGVLFHLKYKSLRRAELKGFYECFPCAVANPDNKETHQAAVDKANQREDIFEIRSECQKKRYKKHGTESSRENAKKFYTPEFEEQRKEQRRKLSEKWSDPRYRAQQQDLRSTPEFKERVTKAIRKSFEDPLVQARWLTSVQSDEYRDKQRAISVKRWEEDPVYRERIAIARSNMPVISSLNKVVFSILDSLGVEWESEHPIGPFNFDVFVPSHNLLIEAHGEYWHSLPRAIRNDKSKATYIERYFPEFKLITIWELEFHTPGRVEHTLRRALGLEKMTPTAPDWKTLSVRPIQSKEAAGVYTNHYIGTVRGKQHFGLFHGDNLIGAASFGPFQRNEQTLRYGKDAVELTRFCIAPEFQVKNLGSWFLSRCLKVFGSVVTYADSTFGHDGALYKACNFKFSHEVPPDYSYVDALGWVIHKRTIWGRAVKMGISEADYVERNGLSKKWGGTKKCFVFAKSPN